MVKNILQGLENKLFYGRISEANADLQRVYRLQLS